MNERDFGRLEGKVDAVHDKVDRLIDLLDRHTQDDAKQFAALAVQQAEWKGGGKVASNVGGFVAGIVGSVVVAVIGIFIPK